MQNEYEKEAQGQIKLITFLTDQHLTTVCSADPHSSAWLPRAFAPLLVHQKLEKELGATQTTMFGLSMPPFPLKTDI